MSDLPKNELNTTRMSVQDSSHTLINYPPSLYLNIDYMWLSIEPDFKTKRISCRQQLKITTLQELEKIELDCAYNDNHKIDIDSIFYSDAASNEDRKLSFQQSNDKLSIEIGEKLLEGSRFYLVIKYSANGTKPPDGFIFIESENHPAYQAWTQGEAIASNKWFPCIDHPQVKFPREVSVIVPDNFIVISNGERDIVDQDVKGEKKKKYVWQESRPITAYVTSIVIGDFAQLPKENYKARIPLIYYVPHGREADGLKLFKNTSKMMEFFESFLKTKYPYDKYAQVTVDDFEYEGMENTTCTTLTTSILPDEKTIRDSNTYDTVIVHELAHQWFGDLVTAKDWQHIWLNESFASYSEALYYQHAFGDDEFYNYMIGKLDDYLGGNVSTAHKVPLVTKDYDTPLDMFSYARTYQKGAWIVHMLRYLLGDEDFKNSLTAYFDLFKHRAAETEDLRRIFEQNSSQSLQQFFDQWIYQAGHPDINAVFAIDNSTINLKIQQIQTYEFHFPLEILIVFQTDNTTEKKIEDILLISNKQVEKSYSIPVGAIIKRIAIDPYLKILKKIKITIPDENNSILLNSLLNGETIVEKIYAARALRGKQDNELVEPLRKVILQNDVDWNVGAEAARTLGTIKTDESYEALKDCINSVKVGKIKESVVRALGSFSKSESFESLKLILENDDESDLVRRAAAIAIAESENQEKAFTILTKLLEKKSHKNIVARGAIEGLKVMAIESRENQDIGDIESVLIEKSKIGNESRLRQTAASALGYVAKYHKERTNIIDHLKTLLNDESIHIRNTSYASLGNVFAGSQNPVINQELKQKIEKEDNEFVKQTGERSLKLINESASAQIALGSEKSLLKEGNYKINNIEDMEKNITMF